jgi:hypothetical protein
MDEHGREVVDTRLEELLGAETQRDWFTRPLQTNWAPVESLIGDQQSAPPSMHISLHGTVGGHSG